MSSVEVVVPDIGTDGDVDVIEILVKPGDRVAEEDALITLESDKATMDVPSPVTGTVKEIRVSAGERVREGSVIVVLDLDGEASALETPAVAETPPISTAAPATQTPSAASATPASGREITIAVPDVGSDDEVDVIEVHVSVGDQVAVDDALITLESDKASMDVPATSGGTITAVHVEVGAKVRNGDHIVTLTTSSAVAPVADTPPQASATPLQSPAATQIATPASTPSSTPVQKQPTSLPQIPRDLGGKSRQGVAHASPSIRRFARELGADLELITGTGRKGRIVREDVQAWIKAQLSGSAASNTGGSGIPPVPAVDFSKFGEIETVELTRIKRISGPFLQRSWLNIPHVTHHDEADITEMDEFRKSLKPEAEARGVKITPIVFAMRALVAAMRKYPQFNASLAPDGEHLILKKYFHIGIAVDTPGGLVVPVVRDVDQKGLMELAEELGDISERARAGKLKSAELQGGCMSISSLGGIGGTAFTPIVNAPEVAILGLARSRIMPVWDGKTFQPRLMQPLDLSYDHRAVDGAEAARFTVYLRDTLNDIRRMVL